MFDDTSYLLLTNYFKIVLGGGVGPANPPRRPHPDLGGGADRVWHAARLYRRGLAPIIILTGGRAPGLESRDDIQTEAQAMRLVLIDFGVPDSAMVLEEGARNTRENASRTKALIGEKRVALVTSAFHMPRARALFEAQGLKVLPFPVDFRVVENDTTILDFLPSAGALETTTSAMRELLGRVYYWIRS